MKNLTKYECIILSKALLYISKAEKLLNKLKPFSETRTKSRKPVKPEGMEFGINKTKNKD